MMFLTTFHHSVKLTFPIFSLTYQQTIQEIYQYGNELTLTLRRF